MSVEDDFDPWIQFPAASEQVGSALHVEVIDGVQPLDDQFGAEFSKAVPDALHEILFGQLKPGDAGMAKAGGNPENVPPLNTYAILDGAKVTNLPELLDTSGLKHRCLFKGQAFEDLKHVAPWIVHLEEDGGFTRNLFTRSNAPWHLWDAEPGIYLRSRGTLDEMWTHFRKFTKVQDASGKWYYLRLHDPRAMVYYLDGLKASHVRVQQVFTPRVGVAVHSIIAISVRDETVSVLRPMVDVVPSSAPTQDGEIFELDSRYTEDFLSASVLLLRKYAPELNTMNDRELMWLARQNVRSFHQFDLISKPVIANTLAIVALCKHPLDRLTDSDLNLLKDITQSQFRRTSTLLQQIKHRVSAQHG